MNVPFVQLTKEEASDFLVASERVDGFADGARAMAEYLKQRKVDEILQRRATPEPTAPSNSIPLPPGVTDGQ